MILFVILCFLALLCEGSSSICEVELPHGKEVNLKELGVLSVDLGSCLEDHHHIKFNLCEDLANSDCPSEQSTGPGNACDTYESVPPAYWWVGGVLGFSHVKEKDSDDGLTFTLSYEGIKQTFAWNEYQRSLKVTLECNIEVETPQVTCIGIEQHSSGSFDTIYKIKITTCFACPKISQKVDVGKVVGIVVGSIAGGCCLLCCIVIILVCCFCLFCGGVCVGQAPKGYFKLGGKGEEEDDDEVEVVDGVINVLDEELGELASSENLKMEESLKGDDENDDEPVQDIESIK